MDDKIYVSDGLLCKEVNISGPTVDISSPLEPFTPEVFATADIAVMCTICEEYTPMNSHDYRTQGVFICSKCKAAVKHVRDYLENGGSVV